MIEYAKAFHNFTYTTFLLFLFLYLTPYPSIPSAQLLTIFKGSYILKVWGQYYLPRDESLHTTLAFPVVLQNIISQDLKENLIILINMCCNTHQGSLKDKGNIL